MSPRALLWAIAAICVFYGSLAALIAGAWLVYR